jgi:hypothetical protein
MHELDELAALFGVFTLLSPPRSDNILGIVKTFFLSLS